MKFSDHGARVFFVSLLFILHVTVIFSQNPGTAADPLVSKSYVDHFIRFRAVMLPVDTHLKPEVGAMLVVRSGQLRLEAAAGKSVIDLTAGREIAGNVDLPLNHLIMIPDSNGIVLKARKATMLMASYLNDEQQP
ncbi:MAG: hypothetical protein PHD82_01625 [Candidatus Riflebacteria bacterium]|nr:hypothetical protein [Candidatus Riflebacteria bacterium]